MKIKTIVGCVLYRGFAMHLPISDSRVRIFQKQLRAFCGKLILAQCGENVNIEKGAMFSTETSLGDYSGIGINAQINGKCTIGKYVMMGPNCTVHTRNHEFSDTTKPMMEQGFSEEKEVIIGDDVWIGSDVTILPGVKIGNHSIIGACSVVTTDGPEYAIGAGNPAKVKKYRKENG